MLEASHILVTVRFWRSSFEKCPSTTSPSAALSRDGVDFSHLRDHLGLPFCYIHEQVLSTIGSVNYNYLDGGKISRSPITNMKTSPTNKRKELGGWRNGFKDSLDKADSKRTVE